MSIFLACCLDLCMSIFATFYNFVRFFMTSCCLRSCISFSFFVLLVLFCYTDFAIWNLIFYPLRYQNSLLLGQGIRSYCKSECRQSSPTIYYKKHNMRSNGEWHTRISSIVSDVFSFSNKLGVFIMQRVAVKNGNVTYIRNIESLNHIVVQKVLQKT